MPVVMALRNPDLKEHHWDDINEMIGQKLDIHEEGFTLQNLIDMNVTQFNEQIVAKGVEATGQAKLGNQLQNLEDNWKIIQFVTKTYKEKDNCFILGGAEDMYTYLDEGLAEINMILGNRFVKIMRTKADKVKKELTLLSTAVEEWFEVQKQWCYLENIFSGGSIKQQLPYESKIFEQVNKTFLQLNTKANRNPQALKFIRATPNIVDMLKKLNADLERINNKLNLYVESKRMIFPRFYFLSQEDLI